MSGEVVMLVALAALVVVGAGIGGYIAAKPAADAVVAEVRQFVRDFEVKVPPVEVEVPQPVIQASISPWSAFWLGLGFVVGMIALQILKAKYTHQLMTHLVKTIRRGWKRRHIHGTSKKARR